jgi:hypothetical protein
MSSGGGGSSGSQTTTQQVILPDWLQSAAQGSLSSAQALAGQGYQANPYSAVAPQTADQTQAYQTIQNMQGQTAPAFQAAEGTAQGLLGQAAPITAGQVGAGATALMNPYTAAVVNPSVQLMRQQLAQTTQGIDANAANVGAFGGSRQGVEEGTAQAQEALQAGQLSGSLLQQGYGQALSTSAGIAGQNQGLGQWATTTLPQLATAGATQTATEAGLLQQAGMAQQQQAQAGLNVNAGNFENQIMWPYEQQQMLEQAVTSTPYGGITTATGPKPTTNTAATALGGAAAGAALGGTLGTAIPGIGNALGAGFGAVGGGLLGFL